MRPQLPVNFDSPYKSQSITEFWRRWHISLSTWLRDYLYIPLGGNRGTGVRTYVNLCLTMLLGGLWHGAAWTFIAWGAYQGAWLVIERLAGKRPLYHFLPSPVRLAVTFVLVMIGWVCFRANSLGQIGDVVGAMFSPWAPGSMESHLNIDGLHLWAGGLAMALVWGFRPTHEQVTRRSSFVPLFLSACFLLAVSHMFFQQFRPFLYFQF